MVNVEFPPNWSPDDGRIPNIPPQLRREWKTTKEPRPHERHIDNVKKGILIEYEDGTYSFLATDDECWNKIKEALNGSE